MTVDGKQVTVAELKPGMNGTAVITKTTTVTPVFVTEIKEGLVAQTSGNSILVRVGSEYRRFSQGDLKKRNITIMKGGAPVELSDLRVNDRLTATIITEGPPQVMTQQQVEATLSSPAAAATAKPSAAAASPELVRRHQHPQRLAPRPKPCPRRPAVCLSSGSPERSLSAWLWC